ncbi:MAG: indole-3-glycerol phosphate synthase TrpC [Bacteroidetes bacterium]|nr:indole-3-glycerol phosphate synthase TrpC [Bacteroidota bacterium]MBU1115789.1 indole-3-glycerol phosphate synthase TrpC [Bacteroidota bacterium]MBU1798535.1 indole-3-glycerol phosphate synthase TrpC [Bacteroidota bacterium]
MIDILAQIVEVKIEEVKKLKRDFTISRFSDSEYYSSECLNFEKALRKKEAISIIAEIKKASPSKGIIRKDFNPLKIADIYMENNVDAISVLTDEQFFQGNISYLNEIAKYKSVPLLRKDFIIDEYQVFEAKANGADAILLISEILSESQIEELSKASFELGMKVLLELHNENQLPKIDFSLNKIIGINNRDLTNFATDLNTTLKISEQISANVIFVSESGISEQRNFDFLKDTKTNAVLIGEHFMKAENIADSVKKIQEYCYY